MTPRDALPGGACDCHTHVIGDAFVYPMVAERHYTPGPAPLAALCTHLARHGLQRVVVVQPSVYGTDNRCMLDALDRLDGRGRGVAVLGEQDTDMVHLRALHLRGVRGLRLNLESAGLRDAAAARRTLVRWAERLADLGWHLQLYAALDVFVALAEALATLPVPVVLDHFALVPPLLAADDAQASTLLALLRSGNAWIKLSAPYRLGVSGAPHAEDVAAWAGHFLHAAPQYVLWGSDWPHTDREPGRAAHEISRYRTLSDGALQQSIDAWLPEASQRQRVLVDNPARLYGF